MLYSIIKRKNKSIRSNENARIRKQPSFLESLMDNDAKIFVTLNNVKTSIDDRFKSELNRYTGNIYKGQDSSDKLSYVDSIIFYKTFSGHYPLLEK